MYRLGRYTSRRVPRDIHIWVLSDDGYTVRYTYSPPESNIRTSYRIYSDRFWESMQARWDYTDIPDELQVSEGL